MLIAGGEGKGADFTPLKTALVQHVNHLYTLGKDGDKIASLMENTTSISSIKEAVIQAKSNAKTGDIILLSPACASFDMFKNYQERGQVFIDAVHSVQEAS